ncbi:uncharacterized protein EV154DRAFT_572640 [Mucor mucedo]|uniref:uncharacterized protein n=1 Tax=Mucor mucedo TaxID=29922 RepID=UPI002220CB29|nr:uncharacterized protein EV154DRAFT_572640 [Mucor mucedo]KAI7863867.1 hypothetical protein EV154DRAFT_572640 [Mucor mucedo]
MREFEVPCINCGDYGEGTLADGYTSLDQVSKIAQFYLNGQRNHGENLRDALAFLFSHYFLLRGESIRNAELTDFQTMNLDSESVRPDIKCPALVMILRQGETNKNYRLELTGCIRSTQVEICPYYDFWLLFKSSDSDTTKVWAYASHRDAVARGLEGAQIFTKKKTHINRGSAARMADLAGVNEDQIRRLGRWNNTTMNGAYLTGLPRETCHMPSEYKPKTLVYLEDQGRTNITTTAIPQQSEPNSFSGINAMDHSQTFHDNINSNVVPCYRMNRGIVSVNDLWHE